MPIFNANNQGPGPSVASLIDSSGQVIVDNGHIFYDPAGKVIHDKQHLFYDLNQVKILDLQQATIANPDGTLAGATTTLTAVLNALRAHGLIKT